MVVAIYRSADPATGATEFVPPGNAELVAFAKDIAPDVLAQADLELIRVLEDLVDLLIDRNLISFSDLPDAAQQKLLRKKGNRKGANSASLLVQERPLL